MVDVASYLTPAVERQLPDIQKPPREWEAYTRLALANSIAQHGWDVGDHSYGTPTVVEAEYGGHLRIGKYCSIGSNVTIVLANHRIDAGTTYPFVALRSLWSGAEASLLDHNKGDVDIGSDVWIGMNACLLPGTTIGSGCVIGAASVVRGSIPPYSIVIGNPGRVIRTRFDERIVSRFLSVRWWDLHDDVVDHLIPKLLGNDLLAFLLAAEEARRAQESKTPGCIVAAIEHTDS